MIIDPCGKIFKIILYNLFLFYIFDKNYNMLKIGDKVRMSDRNTAPNGKGVSAYAGMEGTVEEIDEPTGSFVLNCGNSILVVPLSERRHSVWIWINGELVNYFAKGINPKETFIQRLFREIFKKY